MTFKDMQKQSVKLAAQDLSDFFETSLFFNVTMTLQDGSQTL
jgi:hypothetical protein